MLRCKANNRMKLVRLIQNINLLNCGMVQQRSIEDFVYRSATHGQGDRQRSMRCSLRVFYVREFPEIAGIRGDSTLNPRQD
jgi:hypothetical protein